MNSAAATKSVPAIEPSFNFFQESQIDLEPPHMNPAVVRAEVPVGCKIPPGIPSQIFTDQLFQQNLAGITPAQQQQAIQQ